MGGRVRAWWRAHTGTHVSDFLPWASPFEGNFSDRCGVELPSTGRLLTFYFDGSYDDFASIVGTWDRTTLAGARLVHVAEPRSTCAPLAPPDRVPEFGEQMLSGRQITTHPGWEHPLLRAELGAEDWDVDAWRAHPTQRDAFNEALFALDEGDAPRHQIGGWADPVQGPVELEVAQAADTRDLDPVSFTWQCG